MADYCLMFDDASEPLLVLVLLGAQHPVPVPGGEVLLPVHQPLLHLNSQLSQVTLIQFINGLGLSTELKELGLKYDYIVFRTVLVALNKIVTNKMELEGEEFDIAEDLERSMEMFTGMLRAKEEEVEVLETR